MEKVKELFVILEDRPRALGELMKVLERNKIKLQSIGVFVDSAKLLVKNIEKSKEILTKENYAVEVREVLKTDIPNSPKELAYITERIGHLGLNISHIYGNAHHNKITLIIDVDDIDTVLSLFK